MPKLYHVSGWSDLAAKTSGDTFVLVPGPQHAEGAGVYFAEGAVRVTAAEGCRGTPAAIVELAVDSPRGWWRTKPALARKHGRAITWHSQGANVACRVTAVSDLDGVPVLHCTRL